MTPDEFETVSTLALRVLSEEADRDWSRRAKALDWSCRQTVDHIIDCVFSYTMQVAARAQSGFLPFSELHARAEASTRDLIDGLRAVDQIFYDVI